MSGGGGGGEEGSLMSCGGGGGGGEEGSLMSSGAEKSLTSRGGDHPQPSPADASSLETFFKKLRPSVVTIAIDQFQKATIYGTGFVLLRDGNSCVIMTSAEHMQAGRYIKYSVYWAKNKDHSAEVLGYKQYSKFMFLVVRDIPADVAAVTFSKDPAPCKTVITIGTMAGTKYHTNAKPIRLVSVLGAYKGIIIDDNLEAFDSSGRTIDGSEAYFTLSCSIQDKNVEIENIDDEKHDELHTTKLILSAPVFNLLGEMVGIIYSKGDVPDNKIALHVKHVHKWINEVFGTTTANWKEKLKSQMQESKVKKRMPKKAKKQ